MLQAITHITPPPTIRRLKSLRLQLLTKGTTGEAWTSEAPQCSLHLPSKGMVE